MRCLLAAAVALVSCRAAAADGSRPCSAAAAHEAIRGALLSPPSVRALKLVAQLQSCTRDGSTVVPWFAGRGDVNVLMGVARAESTVQAKAEIPAGTGFVIREAFLTAGTVADGSVTVPVGTDSPARARLLVLPYAHSADAVTQSVRDVPLRGVLARLPEDGAVGPLYLVLAPTLLDDADCSRRSTGSSSGSDDATPLLCAVGGERLAFASAADAGRALQRELALGAVRAFTSPAGSSASASVPVPLPRSLLDIVGASSMEEAAAIAEQHAAARARRRALALAVPLAAHAASLTDSGPGAGAGVGMGSSARRAYIAPSVSRGSRAILGMRVKFDGQADSVLATDAAIRALMGNASDTLNRAAMGAGNGATFSWTLAAGNYTMPATLSQCTSDLSGVTAAALNLVRAADPTLDISGFAHIVVFLPSCPYGWSGLANLPGSNSWMNGLTMSPSSVQVVVHEIGHNVSDFGTTAHSVARTTMPIRRLNPPRPPASILCLWPLFLFLLLRFALILSLQLGFKHSGFTDPITGAFNEYYGAQLAGEGGGGGATRL